MSTSSLFPFAIPDEVREHLVDESDLFELAGEQSKLWFDAGSSEADINSPFEAFGAASVADGTSAVENQHTFVSKQQRDAIVRGDYNLLNKLKTQTHHDLKANIETISKNRGKAFLEAVNKSDGKHYHICPSSTGYMWVMPQKVETEKLPDGQINTRATVSVGSFSKNSNFMGMSIQSWSSIPGVITNTAVSFIVSSVVGNFVANRVAGMIYSKALQAAVVAAEGEAVAGGWVIRAVAAKFVGAVAGSLIMVVAYLVVVFIIDFIHRSYGLSVNIYNYSNSTSWVVNDWYSDNSKIDDTGGTGKVMTTLDKVSNGFKGLDGLPSIELAHNAATFATYTYANDSQWMQGLGVCTRVQNAEDPSIGFYLKYVVHAYERNDIGLQGNINDGMKDYYNKGWAPAGSYVVESKIDKTDIPIKGITTALSHEESHLYNFDVYIGVKAEGA